MSGFVQIIEWKSSKIDEMMTFAEEWRGRHPEMGPSRILVCGDRDAEGTFLSIVEFPSYEAAMENSEDPATSDFAGAMNAMSVGPPSFRNLDVLKMEQQ